nr:Transcription factor YY2 [Ipomoea batatas]
MEAQKFHNLFDRRPIAKSRAPATKWFKECCSAIVLVRRSRDFWNYADVLIEETRDSSASLFRSTTNWWSLCLKGRTKKTARTAILKLSTLFLYSNSSTKQTCGHGVDERAETGKLRTRLGIDESREATMVA